MMPVHFAGGAVDDEMTSGIYRFLRTNMNSKVRIYLNTAGGDVQQAREICRIFQAHGHVHLIANGECSSSGTLLMCAAARRSVTPSCIMLFHYGEETATTPQQQKYNRQLSKWEKELYKSRLNVSWRTVSSWLRGDVYIYPERAIRVGLADDLWSHL